MTRAVLLSALLGLLGCEDGGATADLDAGRSLGDAEVVRVRDALVLLDAQIFVDAAPVDDAASPPGPALDAGPVCAEPGLRQCVAEDEAEVEVCQPDRTWRISRCPDGLVCLGGDCVPAGACVEGDSACGDGGPVRCVDGSWQVEATCGDDAVCANGQCTTVECAAAAQTRSYLGCEYWAVDLESYRTFGAGSDSVRHSPLGLVVFNPDLEAPARLQLVGPDAGSVGPLARYTVEPPTDAELPVELYAPRTLRSTVRDAAGAIVADEIAAVDGLLLPPGGLATLLLPRAGEAPQPSSVVRKAWRLNTDRPVAAYQFNPLCCNFSFSNDASLLLPAPALGQRYRFLGAPSQSDGNAELAVVATQDDTEVLLRLPPTARPAGDDAGRLVPGEDGWRATLAAHEVLSVHVAPMTFDALARDLSGIEVESSEAVAVFSGHHCARAPASLRACDHLEEQLFPTQAWGRAFALVPLATRVDPPADTEVTYFKLIADRDATRVILGQPFDTLGALPPANVGAPSCADALTEPDVLTLDAGQHCEMGLRVPVGLAANQPLLVMGVISGQASTGVESAFGAAAGDPSAFLVPPDRQYRRDYVFLTPDTFAHDYLLVVADPDATVTLDGAEIDLSDGTPVPGTTRVFVHLRVPDGPHRVAGDDAFGIVVYAYDDFVSYAFTGGLNLEKE